MLKASPHTIQRLLGLWCIPALLVSAPAAAVDEPSDTVSETVEKSDGDADASDPSKDGEDQPDAFPLSASIGIDNSLGNGWISSPNQLQIPSFSQSLSPSLSMTVPSFGQEWLPKMSLSSRLSVSIEWMDSYYTTVYSRVPRLTDSTTTLSFPGLYTEEVTGLSLSASVNGRLPLSLLSRRANVWGALGAGGALSWSSAKLGESLSLPEWAGTVSASLAPSVLVFGHTATNSSRPTEGSPLQADVARRGDPVELNASVPAAVCRDGEILPNGECPTGSRRVWMSASAGSSLGWSSGKHSVNASLGLIYAFYAPLANQDPALSSSNASGQDFGTPLSTGSLSYSYTVPTENLSLPVDTNLSFSTGISSFQPAWNMAGTALRFPWWDFVTSPNNFSAGFVSANLSI